jgi:hypothetical protein
MKLHIYKFYQLGDIRFHACDKRAVWMEDDWEYLGEVDVQDSSKSDAEIVLEGLRKEEEAITTKYLDEKGLIETRRREYMALENS